MKQAIEKAVAAERERCAEICRKEGALHGQARIRSYNEGDDGGFDLQLHLEACCVSLAYDILGIVVDEFPENDAAPTDEGKEPLKISGQCNHGVPLGQDCDECKRTWPKRRT
jgi:hypothetical protein